VVDNDAPCEDGRVCVIGRCLLPDDANKVMAARQADGGVTPDAGPSTIHDRADAASTSEASRSRSPGCALAPGAGAGGIAWLLLVAAVALLRRRR
jgi:MYXO-CTERM domain-containing protein